MACLHEPVRGFTQLSGGLSCMSRRQGFIWAVSKSDADGGAEPEVGITLCLQQAVGRGNGRE